MSRLSHIGADGRARMVDISGKKPSDRYAKACGLVRTNAATLAMVEAGKIAKGNVIAVAELAGVMAAKRTSELIPLCHPLPLTSVQVKIELDFDLPGLKITAECKTAGRTGVEMEALTAVSVACLTVYDMLKGATRDLTIEGLELMEKRGGASGDWQRDE